MIPGSLPAGRRSRSSYPMLHFIRPLRHGCYRCEPPACSALFFNRS